MEIESKKNDQESTEDHHIELEFNTDSKLKSTSMNLDI